MPDAPLLLGVNIDHVATLRQARLIDYPDPLRAARLAIESGADSITVHLREDKRHIQESDVVAIRALADTPLNLEMAATDKMFQFAKQLQPDYCCIVPEKRQELTTEGGLDVVNNVDNLKYICSGLQNKGIKVSLFIDADAAQLDAAIATETDMIEIHTGHFASATDKQARQKELNKISQIAESGVKRGLQVNAGHGLNYDNVTPIAANSCITELNIGHAIVAEAIFTGLTQAVERMKKLMEAARS